MNSQPPNPAIKYLETISVAITNIESRLAALEHRLDEHDRAVRHSMQTMQEALLAPITAQMCSCKPPQSN